MHIFSQGYKADTVLENIVMRFILVTFLILMPAHAFSEGEVGDLRDFTYWDNSKVKNCTIYDKNGRLKAKAFCRYDGTVEKTEKYDIYGNMMEEVLYDQRGDLKVGIDGWAAMRWWYDGSRLISQISYDEQGRPVERKQYSESGKLVLRQFRDDVKIDPYEEASMAILLGGRNMKYYDSGAPFETAPKLSKE